MPIDNAPVHETLIDEAPALESSSKTELMERVKNLQSALEVSRKEQMALQALFTKERLAKIEHFAKISHELRSPLNSILLLCNVLTQNNVHNLTPQQKENIIAINAAGKDLLYIINDMVDQSTKENQVLKVYLKTVFTHELMSSLESVYTAQFEQKKIAFSIKNHCAHSFSIVSDPNKVVQILRNLLSNAYKYTPEGGKVEMQLSHSNENFIIDVIDSGPGLTIEEQQTIFNPFILGEEGMKNKGASLGLGLSIAKKIADSLHATLSFKSIDGTGSTFTLALPIHMQSPSSAIQLQPSISPEKTRPEKMPQPLPLVNTPTSTQKVTPYPLKNKKIMLVERNLSIIYFFRKVLLTYGAELTHAFDIPEALACLKLSPSIDLVLCSYYEGYTPKELQTHFSPHQIPLVTLPITQTGEAPVDTETLLFQLETSLRQIYPTRLET
jgi:signal transduction histidine kinase